jgi:hypothetical protein
LVKTGKVKAGATKTAVKTPIAGKKKPVGAKKVVKTVVKYSKPAGAKNPITSSKA